MAVVIDGTVIVRISVDDTLSHSRYDVRSHGTGQCTNGHDGIMHGRFGPTEIGNRFGEEHGGKPTTCQIVGDGLPLSEIRVLSPAFEGVITVYDDGLFKGGEALATRWGT